MKKFLLFALAAICLPTAMWAYDFEYDGMYFTRISNTTVSIDWGSVHYEGDVVVPATVYDEDESEYTVVTVGQDCFAKNPVTSVSLPNTIETIYDHAFFECEDLTELTIPGSVTYMGEELTTGSSIQKLTFEEGVTYVGYNSFWASHYLEEIVLPSTLVLIDDDAFSEDIALTKINLEDCLNLTTLGLNIFWYCSSLEELTLPPYVDSIGHGCFAYCSALKSLYILNPEPISLGTWEDYFVSCTSFPTVYVPAGSGEAYDNTWTVNQKAWLNEKNPIVELDYAVLKLSETDGTFCYGTYYNDEYNVVAPGTVDVFTVPAVSEDGVITFNEIESGMIPAGTGVVLRGEIRAYSNVSASAPRSADVGDNMLIGSQTATTTFGPDNGDYYYYTLDASTWYGTMDFVWGSSDGSAFEIEGHKAWLPVPKKDINEIQTLTGEMPERIIEPEPEPVPDAIESVEVEEGEPVIYNLQGVRVSDMSQRGIYIVNGKKVVKK